MQVKSKCERSLPVRPPGVEKTSRLHSRDPVASGVKCRPHGGKNSKMKSWKVSWLSHKTKVEPGLHGSRVMSGDWRRLHRVRGVSNGSQENHRVPWLIHKAKTEESKTKVQQHITQDVRGWQPSLGTLAHLVFLFSLPIFLRISIGLA
jgi:hypothetical protein